jgi:GGDEF domain-containing protein
MNTNHSANQDVSIAILAVWSILAATSIVLIDPQTYVLALALLTLVVTLTSIRPFPYSSIITMLVSAVLYLVVYFSIVPFVLSDRLVIPVSVVLIFAATSGLGSLLIRAMSRNVGQLRNDMQLLSDLIQFDSVTGLLLWRHASQKLETELARCRRYYKTFGLILLEPANTEYEMLSSEEQKELNLSISKLLLQTCRTDVDTAFIGHHFGVLLPETDAAGTASFAKRLIANSAKTALINLRIGIAFFPEDGVTSEILITACDAALQSAIHNEQSIVSASNLLEAEKLVAHVSEKSLVDDGNPAEKRIAGSLQLLGSDEYLLTFSDFYNMADLPLLQENLSQIKEIEEVSLVDYSEGRLIFKVKSKKNLADKELSEKIKQRLRESWIARNQKGDKVG